MLISPKKSKYKKCQKGKIPNFFLSKRQDISFGKFAIKSESFGILKNNQIDSARKLILKRLKKKGKMWVTFFTHTPKTKKPVEIRMGKGKGSVDSWIAKIRPGLILYEMDGISESVAKEIFNEVKHKLPIKCKFVCH